MKTFDKKRTNSPDRPHSKTTLNAHKYDQTDMRKALYPHHIMAKFKNSTVNNSFEQEADHIANSVVNGSTYAHSISQLPSSGIAKKEKTADPQPAKAISALPSAGRGLNTSEKSYFETRFSRRFNGVVIHDNDHAASAAESINARAFTTGNHIYLNAGEYNFASDRGKRLMAHELTHTVQQQGAKNTIQRSPKTKNNTTKKPFSTYDWLYKDTKKQLTAGDKNGVKNSIALFRGDALNSVKRAINDFYKAINKPIPIDLLIFSFEPEKKDPNALPDFVAPPKPTSLMPSLDFLTCKGRLFGGIFTLKIPTSFEAKFPKVFGDFFALSLTLTATSSREFSINISRSLTENIGGSIYSKYSHSDRKLKTGFSIYTQSETKHFHGEERQKQELLKKGKDIEAKWNDLDATMLDENGVLKLDKSAAEKLAALGASIKDFQAYVTKITPGKEEPDIFKTMSFDAYMTTPLFPEDDETNLGTTFNIGFSWYF